MSGSGTGQHRLEPGTHPSWSPRGSRLAFEHQGFVYTMTDRGRSVRRIAKGEQPVWAPRGTRIAFLRDTELFVADADATRVRRLADLRCESYGEGDSTILSSPEWSPRAQRLVVSVTCDHGRTYDVFAALIDADGGVTDHVPLSLATGSRIAWSPNGARLAYSLALENYGDAPRIVTTLLDGSSMTTVSTGAGDDRDPDW
jgi:Tol biopolymer transport system component